LKPLFDCYLAVDWSAANRPARGKDSIWLATRWSDGMTAGRNVRNIPTRREAEGVILDLLKQGLAQGRRILCGFDFAFGYPEGLAENLTGEADWQAVWKMIGEEIEDDPDNRSNRFDVGGRLNRKLGHDVFWGHPQTHHGRYDGLGPTKPAPPSFCQERRHADRMTKGAQSPFKLAYAGSVGSQSLLGIPVIMRLRKKLGRAFSVWPFETEFAEKLPAGPSVVVAEIYPTLYLRKADKASVKDRQQVLAVVDQQARLDREGRLIEHLSPPPSASDEERAAMLREEGSIMGIGALS
jgi:precorrin-8X/cobalt-precorrin-8 methylmutase